MPILLTAAGTRMRHIRETADQYFRQYGDCPSHLPIHAKYGHFVTIAENGRVAGRPLNILATTISRKFGVPGSVYGNVVVTPFTEAGVPELLSFVHGESREELEDCLRSLMFAFEEEPKNATSHTMPEDGPDC